MKKLLLALGLLSAPVFGDETPIPAEPTPWLLTDGDWITIQVNNRRAEQGLEPVIKRDELTCAAALHAATPGCNVAPDLLRLTRLCGYSGQALGQVVLCSDDWQVLAKADTMFLDPKFNNGGAARQGNKWVIVLGKDA